MTVELGNGKVRVRLGDIVEDALAYMYHHMERPRPVLVGADDLTQDGTVLSIQTPTEVNVTDRLERGHEIMLVTKKDETTAPVTFTVTRGYESTPKEGAAQTGTALLKNPRWKRYDVWRAVMQGLAGSIWAGLPMTVEDGWTLEGRIILLPDDTLGVARVGFDDDPYWGTRWVDDWQFLSDVTGSDDKGHPALEVHQALLERTSQVRVRRQVPYPIWTTTAGTTTATITNKQADENFYVDLWRGTQDIVALYAAAFRLTGREMGRTEVTAMEGWNSDAAQRLNINLRAVQTLWQQFYQRMDEAKMAHPKDVRRPFHRRVRLARSIGGTW